MREKHGKIEKGYVGSLTILDTKKPILVTKKILKTKCRWSPFEGITFPGSVSMTIVKGKILKNEIQWNSGKQNWFWKMEVCMKELGKMIKPIKKDN